MKIMLHTNMSIKQRTVLGFALMFLLVLIASGMGLLYTISVERNVTKMRNGGEQIEQIENLKTSCLGVVATIDSMLLTRQRGLIERRLNGELEDFSRQLTASQTQSWGESLQVAAQNRSIVNNLQALGVELGSVVNKLTTTIRKGQWAQAQFLRHNDLASLERRFNETLSQLSINVRNHVDKSVAESMRSQILLRRYWILTALVALALGSLAAFLTVTSIIRPIAALVATAQAIRHGDLSEKAEVPSRDELGVLAGVFNSMTTRLRELIGGLEQEVAKRKRVEEEIKNAHRRLDSTLKFVTSIISAVPIPLFYKDRDGRYLGVNDAFAELMGFTPDYYKGKTLMELWPGDFAEKYHEKDLELMRHPQKQVYEFRVQDKNGLVRPVLFGKNVFRDENGQVAGIVGAFQDITERKRAEEELTRHRDHLEELVQERTEELIRAKDTAEVASQSKSTFLASMSHELRTPLNAIMGYAQILKREGSLTKKQMDQVDTIYDSGQHLLSLISDILDLSRIEAEKMEVEIKPFNLPDLIQAVLSAIRIKAREKHLSVQYEEGSAVPSMVKGDGRKLQQVLLNLLDNAVKYTERGEITLRVSSSELRVPNDQESNQFQVSGFKFHISDTGIGIPGHNMEQIFEPFAKGRAEGRAIEGIGLGLAICRRLVKLMGGKLSVESEVGKGSIFTVELRLEVMEEVAVETTRPEKVVIGYTSREPSRTKGERKRLLIVDDNITNLSMLVSLLEPLGFEVHTAESGEESVRIAEENRPDLILLDLLMPGMDGHEALRRIRDDEELKRTKVIGVSAAVADKDRVEAFAANCDDFVSKPLDTSVLLDKLKTQLGIEWTEEEYGGRETKDEEGETVKVPPQTVQNKIIQYAERGEFTRLERTLTELESDEGAYNRFCDRIRQYAKRYDDEGIVNYLKARGLGYKAHG